MRHFHTKSTTTKYNCRPVSPLRLIFYLLIMGIYGESQMAGSVASASLLLCTYGIWVNKHVTSCAISYWMVDLNMTHSKIGRAIKKRKHMHIHFCLTTLVTFLKAACKLETKSNHYLKSPIDDTFIWSRKYYLKY